MAAGKINLQANDGKVLGLYAPDGMSANTDIVPANANGDATKVFKVADAVNADEAVSKGQLDAKPSVNAGYVLPFATSSVPSGYLECNGSALSRTVYADLFAIIGTTYGAGDGSTTFNIPDLRGEFIRGFDNGRGIDNGRVVGSPQGDAIRNITGTVVSNYISSSPNNGVGALKSSIQQTFHRYNYLSGTYWGAKLDFNASLAVPTANENRPRNIAMMYCIKY